MRQSLFQPSRRPQLKLQKRQNHLQLCRSNELTSRAFFWGGGTFSNSTGIASSTSRASRVTASTPSHHQAQHSNLPSVTDKPADVELTTTAEHTTEPSGPLTNVGFSKTQHEASTLPPQPPEEVSPEEVEPEMLNLLQSSMSTQLSLQTPLQILQLNLQYIMRAAGGLCSLSRFPQAAQIYFSVEPSPGQQEATAQTPDPPSGMELSSVQQEALAQPLVYLRSPLRKDKTFSSPAGRPSSASRAT
ncbi:hypothetical protein Cadr_000013977 [Camelus dromedarius]|uniref:Leucine-rich repeat-containing protein 37 N-terminal domain-containing protein n=1 Tax=Camelus dromedarius TaxID=9838 RepID=A0A5N4DCZ8_CAMDR|nr:hypothetical protein Cadr_000013977 [Camelus dromedarius]